MSMMTIWRGSTASPTTLDDAVLYAPLTHSLVLSRGTGSPTFTRASTATFTDWEGVLRYVPSGCARFEGARMVRNVMRKSEDFSGAEFTKTNCTVAKNLEGPDGVANSACTVTATGASALLYDTQGITPASCTKAITSVYLKRITGTGTVRISANGANTNVTVALTTSWQRFEASATTLVSGTFPAILIATSGDLIGVAFWQEEDVTGQADQTASEYVSVGVESAPAYHGSMIDGVKCYDTDRSGNPISTSGSYPLVGYVPWEARTNLCLQSNAFATAPWTSNGAPSIVQNATGPDGATSAWTVTDSNAGLAEYLIQGVTLTAATHSFSLRVGKTVGATTYPLVFVGASPLGAVMTLDTNNGVATVWTQYDGGWTIVTSSASCVSVNDDFWRFTLTFLATAASWNLVFWPAATSNPTQSTGTFTPSLTGSAVFYGAQLELGSFATPYIPTTTVAVARNKDEFSETTSGAILTAGGTISLTYIPYHSPVGTIALWGTYVDASNYTAILHDATNLIFRKRIAGVNYDATIANAFTSGTTYKMAASWGVGGSTIYLNGVAGTPHANTTAAQIAATMQVGADGNSLQQPGAAVIKNYIWQRQLSGSEQAAITA